MALTMKSIELAVGRDFEVGLLLCVERCVCLLLFGAKINDEEKEEIGKLLIRSQNSKE